MKTTLRKKYIPSRVARTVTKVSYDAWQTEREVSGLRVGNSELAEGLAVAAFVWHEVTEGSNRPIHARTVLTKGAQAMRKMAEERALEELISFMGTDAVKVEHHWCDASEVKSGAGTLVSIGRTAPRYEFEAE